MTDQTEHTEEPITNDELMNDSEPKVSNTPPQSPLKAKPVITVEDSLAVIKELIEEIEADEAPIHTEAVQNPEVPSKMSSYRHRFALYRKNIHHKSSLNQIDLFKSLAKCLKSTDHSIQILPIRNDTKVHSVTTTDQINSIEQAGLQAYFKPYKKTQNHLSGDYHIASKLSFNDLKDHKNVQTWLNNHGYQMLWSNCQTADMVRIGFLSRVRNFTFRDDLQNFITSSPEWKSDPFQFRMYFDAFTVKNQTAYVLMVDAERPKIEVGLQFFQTYYNGKQRFSPNCIDYLFLPLYKKSYTEQDRTKIITDHDYHIGTNSIVAIKGLQPLDNLIKLVSGVHTTIRKLLLSIPAPNTISGHLFLQIERQPVENWILCCFYSSDAPKVTLKLGSLNDTLKRIVPQEQWKNLFVDDQGLTYNDQVAPLSKKKTWLLREEAPQTTAYVQQSFQNLYTPAPKRSAEETNPEPQPGTKQATATKQRHTNYAQAAAVNPQKYQVSTPDFKNTTTLVAQVTPNQQASATQPSQITTTETAQLNITNQRSQDLHELTTVTNSHSNALLDLRDVVNTLAATQKRMSDDMLQLNHNIHQKFDIMANQMEHMSAHMEEMTEVVNSLKHSPTRSGGKLLKGMHVPEITLADQQHYS